MENLDLGSLGNQDIEKPIPFDDSGTDGMGVSHSPLDLGGGAAATPKTNIPQPVAPKTGIPQPAAAKPRPATPQPVAKPISSVLKPQKQVFSTEERIEGVKTFFTKLHAGAIDFLDQQIARWLQENPKVIVKRTNVVVGEIQAKKTEPNIIITIWY